MGSRLNGTVDVQGQVVSFKYTIDNVMSWALRNGTMSVGTFPSMPYKWTPHDDEDNFVEASSLNDLVVGIVTVAQSMK